MCVDFIFTGISATTPDGIVKVRAICLLASMDLPARAIVTNLKQYNGAFGCLYCNHPGFPKVDNPRSRCWPYTECTIRSEAEIFECAEKAVETGDAVSRNCMQ